MKRTVLFFSVWLLIQMGSAGAGANAQSEEITPTINPLEDSVDLNILDVITDDGGSTGELSPRPYEPLRTQTICPAEPTALTELMLRDIPNYTNRVLQRTSAVLPHAEDEQREREDKFARRPYRPSHVLIAGQANLTPLDLNEYTYTTSPADGGDLTQIFFTTSSRLYSGLRFNEVQEYHWLFLTQTTDGWRLAFMFSSIDDAQTSRAPLPPFESSRSSVGQAVQLWLRDCRANTIEAVSEATSSLVL